MTSIENGCFGLCAVETSDNEHLETKRQIECLRQKLGDSWLGAVPDVLGIPGPTSDVGNEQRHEAQAWLDSQQCPSPVVQVHLSQSPFQDIPTSEVIVSYLLYSC